MVVSLEPGVLLGDRYRLESELGRGGMGVVWAARDERSAAPVAIKAMMPATTSRAARPRRFLREARLAASIHHPNVVRVLDVFELEDGSPILVMERLHGESLRARLDREAPFAIEVACGVVAQIVSAVGAAHAQGVIHRDLKPENVFLVGDSVRVLDFGIAKLLSDAEAPMVSLTTTGAVLGTPLYMSPEQALAERDVDARSDIWSLGVILYECLSGQRPVEGRSVAHVLRSVALGQLTPLAAVAPNIPAPLLDLVNRCLALRREERPNDLREVLEILRAHTGVGVGSFGAARIASTRRQALLVTVAATASIVAAVAAVARVRSVSAVAATTNAHACRASRDCLSDGGAAATCRAGACVAFASEDCVVHADPSAIGDDRTVWFGTLFAKGAAGSLDLAAVDLARQDFDQMMSVYARANPDAQTHSFGVIACDDSVDARRAARHLVDDVGVPAVLGMSRSAEGTDVIDDVLLPEHVLSVVSRVTSPLATRIPIQSGEPRLVWSTTSSMEDAARAIGVVVPTILEPKIRAVPDAIHSGAPLRIAILQTTSGSGPTITPILLEHLKVGLRATGGDAPSVREIVYDQDDKSPEASKAAIDALDAFAPHVVLLAVGAPGYERVLAPFEEAARVRLPTYLLPTAMIAETRAWIGARDERRRRFFGVLPTYSRPVNERFALHFSETSPVKVTVDANTSSSYDAFYLAAYATYALGDAPVTGPELARSIARLVPPGKRIEVGPSSIYAAYEALRAAEKIDLEGAMGGLDFDLTTGEARSDQSLFCTVVDPTTHLARQVESGVVIHGATGNLDGKLECQ